MGTSLESICVKDLNKPVRETPSAFSVLPVTFLLDWLVTCAARAVDITHTATRVHVHRMRLLDVSAKIAEDTCKGISKYSFIADPMGDAPAMVAYVAHPGNGEKTVRW